VKIELPKESLILDKNQDNISDIKNSFEKIYKLLILETRSIEGYPGAISFYNRIMQQWKDAGAISKKDNSFLTFDNLIKAQKSSIF